MTDNFDSAVRYSGPRAQFASLTGSPLWGLSVSAIIEIFKDRGWTHNLSERLPTPFGLGPQLNHFTTPQGRDVIWIPSYGMVQDEEFFTHKMERRAFWLLWQAGVELLITGGTSGTADWRDPQGEDTVRPGDFVIPWSFYRDQDMVGTMPGSDMATGFLPRIALMGDPFCTSLGRELERRVNAGLVPQPFRRVHHPDTVKVSIHPPGGRGSFETDFEVLTWRVLTQLISQQEQCPHVMIFGDCISPILARQMGMHLVYYHIPSNWGQGHPATKAHLVDSLDALYLDVLPQACLNLEIDLLTGAEIPSDCACRDNLKSRPPVYMKSVSPATNSGG